MSEPKELNIDRTDLGGGYAIWDIDTTAVPESDRQWLEAAFGDEDDLDE